MRVFRWGWLVLLLITASAAEAKSFSFPRIDITATVRDDGSMHVVEQRTFDFNGDFSMAYRDSELPPRGKVSNVVMSEGGTPYQESPGGEIPGTYAVRVSGSSFYLEWYFSAHSETRTFTISYDVSGAIIKHADVAELYCQFVGDGWEVPADRVQVTIQLPAGIAASDVRAWAHGPLNGSVQKQDGNVLLTCAPLPARTMVEARVLFPTGVIFSSPRSDSRQALDVVLREEARWAQEANQQRAYARLILGLPALGIALVFLLWLVLYLIYGREYHEPFPPEYVREPLEGWTPTEVGYLWQWGMLSTRDLSATLMDLVRRGALRLIVRKLPHPVLGGLLGEKMEDDYTIERVEGYTGELRPSERYLIETILFGAREEETQVSLVTFRAEAKEHPTQSRDRFQKWQKLAKQECAHLKVVDPASKTAAGVSAVAGGFLIIGAFLGQFASSDAMPGAVMAVMIIAGLVVIAASWFVQRRNPRAAKSLHQWQAFRRYLTDFSQLKRYAAPAVAVWEQYLVFAVVLGVAEEVIQQLQALAPVAAASGQATAFPHWVGADGDALGGFGAVTGAFSSFNQALSTAVSSASSSGGGGGGFSGGGGGGFGGGGGGAR